MKLSCNIIRMNARNIERKCELCVLLIHSYKQHIHTPKKHIKTEWIERYGKQVNRNVERLNSYEWQLNWKLEIENEKWIAHWSITNHMNGEKEREREREERKRKNTTIPVSNFAMNVATWNYLFGQYCSYKQIDLEKENFILQGTFSFCCSYCWFALFFFYSLKKSHIECEIFDSKIEI